MERKFSEAFRLQEQEAKHRLELIGAQMRASQAQSSPFPGGFSRQSGQTSFMSPPSTSAMPGPFYQGR